MPRKICDKPNKVHSLEHFALPPYIMNLFLKDVYLK